MIYRTKVYALRLIASFFILLFSFSFGSLVSADLGTATPKDEITIVESEVEARCENFDGTAEEQLTVPAGATGSIKYISETGSGLVRMSLDGTNPNTDSYPEFTGPYNAVQVDGVRLDQIRLNGTSGSSDYTICYEIDV